jgi:hypothetical protein
VRAHLPDSAAYVLPGALIEHGHVQCYDLIAGPASNAAWVLGCGAFVDYEGKELKTLAAAVAYFSTTGRDVYVWWEGLEWEEPANGWRGPGGMEQIRTALQTPSLSSPPPQQLSPSSALQTQQKSLNSDGICTECFRGELEGSLVHCDECPRSYHVPRDFNSSRRDTRSSSHACTVRYVRELSAGTVFTCDMVGMVCTKRKVPILE